MSPEHLSQFLTFALANRWRLPSPVMPDGEFHRFSTKESGRGDAGWYVLHDWQVPCGVIGCWRTGRQDNWRADVGRELTPAEVREIDEFVAATKRRSAEERALKTAGAAERAMSIWNESDREAPADHPYLVAKQVNAFGLRLRGDRLVVPLWLGGELSSLQFIHPDGRKSFLKGGRTGGGYFVIGEIAGSALIAEGYATAATLHEVTREPVVVAFNAGNLPKVARAIRDLYPEARITVCADDDRHTEGNPGLAKAREAAVAVEGWLAVPKFPDPDSIQSDFNDLCALSGSEAVAEQVRRAERPVIDEAATQLTATVATAWEDPLPIERTAVAFQPFPLDQLPPAILDAVVDYQKYGQQPPALVVSSALSVVSLAVQGLANVSRDQALQGPISLNFLVVAQSGERKTSADSKMAAPIKEWEDERAESMRDEIRISHTSLETWQAKREALINALKRGAGKKNGANPKELERQLFELDANRPRLVIAPRLRYEDVNAQSLPYMLEAGYPTAALWSDEGGIITGSHGMATESQLGFLTILNRLWDGGEIHQDRKTSPSVHVSGRRLTVSLMIQGEVLSDFLSKSKGLVRGCGLLARFLITSPPSTMGTRLFRESRGMPEVVAFQRRIRELLEMRLPLDEVGRLQPPTLNFSTAAKSEWIAYHDSVEKELSSVGDYYEVRDLAAKSAENVARMAACFHLYAGSRGDICLEHVRCAASICRWYLRESLRVFDLLEEPKVHRNAKFLEEWLLEEGDKSPREVLRFGPSPLRKREDRDAAAALLMELGRLRMVATHPNEKRYEVNPLVREEYERSVMSRSTLPWKKP